MLDNAIEILNIIESNGFEAYIVGGYVRDKLLGIESFDIDITTNAKPDNLLKMFDNINISNEYGSFVVLYNNYKYEITTYRKDLSYDDFRRPNSIEYVDTLYEDLLRRDFSINTLCMDKNQNIIDLLGAMDDINNKLIRCVGNPKVKLKEDSLRILRAIRFASTLDFSIESSLYSELKNSSNLLLHLSYDRKKEELNKIFQSHNLNYGIDLINKLEFSKKLEIEAKNSVIYTNNVLGIWSQIDFSEKYNFSNKDKKIIQSVKHLIDNGNIGIMDVYKLDKEIINIASQILNIDSNILYNNLTIKTRKDINISYKDIISTFNVSDKQINAIYVDLEEEILYNNVINEKKEIIEYLKTKYEMR